MRVVYSVAANIGGSGIGLNSFEMLKAIYERGYLAQALAYRNRQKEIPSRLIRCIRFHPVKIFSNLPSRYYYPVKRKALDRMAAGALKRGADLFHGWSSSSLASLEVCNARGIVSFMENPGPHYLYAQSVMYGEAHASKRRPGWFQAFFEQGEDYHLAEYEAAQFIFLQSEFCRQTFIDYGVPAAKLIVTPKGVNTGKFTPAPKSDQTFRVLFVGALKLRKGLHYLLEAWASLQLKDAELVLAGTVMDEVKDLLARYSSRCPSIRVLGQVSQTVPLYQQASVFVLPSLSEGSAKVTYEAMACGLPVIVTPNAGAVARDGEHGFVVPIKDAEAIAQKLLTLHSNPEMRHTMGLQAREYVRQYSWRRHCEFVLDCYEKACRGEAFDLS